MTIYELAEFEEKYAHCIRAFQNSAVESVKSANYSKVKKLTDNIVIVQASTLGCPGATWMPSYYIQNEQARAVNSKLHNCMTAQAILNTVADMLNEKRVKVGKETVFLNPATLTALKDWLERSKDYVIDV